MSDPFTQTELSEHFAHCIQVLGGTTAASRRLGIDERAIRRFVTGEKPISERLMRDTATVLQALIEEASAAEARITAALGS